MPIRRGFTIIELLVVMAVIGLLVAITVPAVQAARSASHRMSCSANLHQLGLAVAGYETAWGCYPPGYSFRFRLLPYLEEGPLYALVPQNANLSLDSTWGPVAGKAPAVFRCPADGTPPTLLSFRPESAVNYVGCKGHHWGLDRFDNGLFIFPMGHDRKQVIMISDVMNGLSNTSMISEVLHGLGNENYHRMRTLWNTPDTYNTANPAELETFMSVCESLPVEPRQYGWLGSSYWLGVPWYKYVEGQTAYYHSLPPNRPSCTNGGAVQSGLYTAASLHGGGVQMLYADGRVAFTSEAIDRVVWRNAGSRHAPLP